SFLYLLKGKLEDAWPLYNHRVEFANHKPNAVSLPWPHWDGQPLADKSIYLRTEQGHGDTILWARFIHALLNEGAKITLQCDQQMVRLMEHTFPGITVIGG